VAVSITRTVRRVSAIGGSLLKHIGPVLPQCIVDKICQARRSKGRLAAGYIAGIRLIFSGEICWVRPVLTGGA
jgi:hypothetical protein